MGRAHGRAAKAPATVELVYRYLVAVYRAAVADRLVSSSPCVGVKLPKIEPAKVVPLPVETVAASVEVMPERYRALVVLAAGTGLRQGEALGVTVDRVDFLRRSLTVDRQLVLVAGQVPTLAATKTAASHRTVPLSEVVLGALAAHLGRFPARPDGLIFTTHEGQPIRRNRFSEVWRPAARAAESRRGRGCTPSATSTPRCSSGRGAQ